MADEKVETTAPAAPPTASAEPTPGAAPITVQPTVAAPAASSEAPKVEAPKPAFTPHTDTPTLLQEAKIEEPKPEAKPAEVKPPEKPAEVKPEAKPEEAKPAEAKPPETLAPIIYQDFKLPEGIVTDKERMTEFTTTLGKHRIPQEIGQELLDLHTKSLQNFQANTLAEQHRAFADTRKQWRTQVMADPELGGAGHQTAMGAVARIRDALAGDMMKARKFPDGSPRMSELDEFLAVTGAGDHPVFLRLLHNAAQFLDEPRMGPVDIKPSPTNGQRPGRRGMRDIYNKPS